MKLTLLAGLCVVVACASAQNFADYDYQDAYGPQPAVRQPQRPSPQKSQFQGPSNSRLEPTTTRAPPVAILKQINRHNDDGSYTYGYEAADGAFKIETKLVTGEVMGKYGYVDSDGKLRTVEYGANKYGFQPSGEGITVPPPTLVDETIRRGPNGEPLEYEDNYFAPEPTRQAPEIPSRPKTIRPRTQQPQHQYQQQPQQQPQHQIQQHSQQQPQYNDVYVAPTARAQSSNGPVPSRAVISGAAPSYQPAPQPPQTYRPAPQAAPVRSSHPSSFSAPRPRPAPVREAQRSAPGVLDSLAQQYAIPQGSGSTPLTDITFGSYSSQTSF